MRLTMAATVAASLVLLAACSGPPSSEPQPEVIDPPFACHAGDLILCQAMVEGAAESLVAADGRPLWAEVGTADCDGPCMPGLAGSHRSRVTIELDGATAISVMVELRDGQVTGTDRLDTPLIARRPESGPAPGPQVAIELGHCGLASGIDVDGSFWNPIGLVAQHPDAINAARGTFSLIDSRLAALRTEGGLLVQLVRHGGPKHFPACD